MTRLLALLSFVLVLAGCSGNQSMFNPQGPAARSLATLGWTLLTISVVVYVLVIAAMFWALTRRRTDEDDSPATTRALTRTVTAATVVTAVILVVLTAASVIADRGLTTPSGPGAIEVDVIGHRFWWDFRYRHVTPSQWVNSPNELHVPIGVPVVLNVQSTDVIHSFWVPNLHGKRDLVPGQITHTWIQADAAGVYRGQCAEFCGYQHANMAFLVVAEPMADFQKWIQHQREPAAEPSSEAARHGQNLFVGTTCIMCHAVRGTTAGSRVGPDLTHVGSRQTIAAGTLPNTHEQLRKWISGAQSIKPGNVMPSHALAGQDLEAVVSYLRSLQ
jgi:cytochrome c oxidase subunit 2